MKSMYTPFNTIFLYSRKENEYDDIVLSFVSECTPFFRIFSSVPVVSFPESNETADLNRVSDEYLDILGTESLDFIVVSSSFGILIVEIRIINKRVFCYTYRRTMCHGYSIFIYTLCN